MTKRKHAAPSVTAHIGSTARNPLHNSEGLHSTSSAPTSAVKKTKVTKESGSAAVAGLATAKDLDIDDIFKRARGTKRILVNTEKKVKAASRAPKVEGSKDDLFGSGQPKQRRYDGEGLPLYTPEELSVGAGGNTDQCPFDCDCCF